MVNPPPGDVQLVIDVARPPGDNRRGVADAGRFLEG
jgi:hypothetical protein